MSSDLPSCSSLDNHRPHHGFRRVLAFLTLFVGLVVALVGTRPESVLAVTFDFDNFVPLEGVPAFPSVNADGTTTQTLQNPQSNPHALEFVGHDYSATDPSYAYFTLFDVSIPISGSSTLEYSIMPLTSYGRFVAIDLVLEDGRTLRDSGAVDQFGVLVHPQFQGASGRLLLNQYNRVTSAIGEILGGGRIVQIVVGYDQPANAGFYHAIIDDISFSSSKPTLIVKGLKLDEADLPFADARAIIDPLSSPSTCGPDLAHQFKDSKACGQDVNPFIALTRRLSPGDLRLKAYIPFGRDVLVSVCDKEGRFACDDHPPDSYCRPPQSSHSTIRILLDPLHIPSYIGVRWKYIPESQAALFPSCDRYSGSPRMVPTSSLATGELGDTDGDGFLTVLDGIRVLRCAAGPGVSSYYGCFARDLDGDGTPTATDAAMIFRLAAGLPACSADCDTDSDGLLDRWEVGGYDEDADGLVDVDLPTFGARMFHKDVFVECDYMVAADHTHRPLDEAVAMVVDAFANSPVPNLDGKSGVQLHVDTGSLGGGDALPHDDTLSPAAQEFDDIRAIQFAAARAPIFHYCVWGHNYDATTSSGRSFGIPADGFIVTLGAFTNQVGTVMQQGGSLMHELGHNLGLYHGGFEDGNYKPNYLSVMNYAFTFGLRFGGSDNLVDYSRLFIADLNENALNEVLGLNTAGGDGVLGGYGTSYFDAAGAFRTVDVCAANVDWDGDGNPNEQNVAVDVNHDGGRTVLRSFTDWDNLQYEGGAIGSRAVSENNQETTCITFEEAQSMGSL